MISKIASLENTRRHLCFKLDHARYTIPLIQDHDFDINYKTRNRNPDSETRFGFRIKKCAPDEGYSRTALYAQIGHQRFNFYTISLIY
jgi:hypothetical protein